MSSSLLADLRHCRLFALADRMYSRLPAGCGVHIHHDHKWPGHTKLPCRAASRPPAPPARQLRTRRTGGHQAVLLQLVQVVREAPGALGRHLLVEHVILGERTAVELRGKACIQAHALAMQARQLVSDCLQTIRSSSACTLAPYEWFTRDGKARPPTHPR